MKVGDYVKYKYENGIYIGKIKFISEVMSGLDETLQLDIDNCMEEILKLDVIKSSPNIIDLIEVGDILVIKDFVDEACMVFTDIYLIQNEQQLLNIKNDLEKNKNKKLYSIVTKEQFESMEYKVKE